MARERGHSKAGRVLAPDWHAAEIGAPLVSIDAELRRRWGPTVLRAAGRLTPLRGLLIFIAARNFDRVGVVLKSPGALTLTALEALTGRPRDRLVLLTFLPREPSKRPLVNLGLKLRFQAIERPAVRRAMRAGHVLTEAEQHRYAERYRVPITRFRVIPWALASGTTSADPASAREPRVIASGRAFCDWETLFAAARTGDWPLTVICGARDADRVAALNEDERAHVLVEIENDEHDRLLAAASVYALCLRDEGPSAGHVRLLAAVDAGLAVVASDVRGLEGYVVPGETAELVPPRDPEALAQAIGALLSDEKRRRLLAAAAQRRARRWTYTEMWRALGELLT